MDPISVEFAQESAFRMIDSCQDLEQLKGLTRQLMRWYFSSKGMLATQIMRPGKCNECPIQ